MAYTYEQLRLAYAAVHGGIEPTSEVASQLMQLTADATVTDAQRMSYILNSADDSTSVAVLSYQFFTGKSPTANGVAYLVNSTTNATDLSDAYFAPLNLENRFINFAGNLALFGEGKVAFENQYGAMSFASYVASIYDTIIGNAQARAVGLDPAAIILDIIARRDLLLTSARSAGMITDTSTQAEIDLALKAATAAYLLGEGIKADVGIYAASTNNFMLGLAKGDTVYNTDITETYKPTVTSGSSGKGVAVDNPPPPVTLPGGPTAPQPPTQEPAPEPEPPAPAKTFTLTSGADTFTGEALGDTFSGTHLTLNATDALDGGGGADSLTITATAGATYALPAASVTSIETATIINDAGLSGDVRAWTGLTQANTTSAGEYELKLAGSTSLTATVTALGANSFVIDGGKALDVAITGATTAALDIGAATAATGAVKITRETTGAVTAGQINVTGGTTVNVIQKAANATGSTQINGVVTVNGSADTTEVTVKADKAATANGSTAGITAARVTISDVNTGSTTQAGTITKASVDGYSTLVFKGTGLTDLSLAHGAGDITIDNSGLTTPTNKTLNLGLNGLTGGVLDDADIYTTLNVTTGAEASTLANVTFAALATLNLDGASQLKLTSTPSLAALTTVKITGAAGLNANLTTPSLLASIDASGTSGANTLTINGARTAFTGGSGVDTITLSGTTISKAIDLGAGDDILTLANGTTTLSAPISGGAGTDTLVMAAADAATASQSNDFTSKISGFERLQVSASGDTTIDVGAFGLSQVFVAVTTTARDTIALNNVASGGTIELADNGPRRLGYAFNTPAFETGPNDLLNLVLSHSGRSTTVSGSGILISDGLETLNVTITDTGTNADGSTLPVLIISSSVGLKTLNIAGNSGMALTNLATSLTSLDASGITLGGFTWTSGALTDAASIKGSATGTNTVTFSAATGGAITYVGGTGNDVITGANGRDNVISLGDGTNSYTGGTGSETITVGNGANTINVGTGAGLDTVNVTAANAASATVFTSVTNFGNGDKLNISAQGGAAVATTLGAEVTGQSTLAAYLDAAAAGDGHGTALMNWFRFGGDTYVVLDSGAGSTFTAGTDIVVKLVGAVDLQVSHVSGGALTYTLPI